MENILYRYNPWWEDIFQNELISQIKKSSIKSVILIDYPGFNLSFAKKIKKIGVKIIYYISPQIWAWGKHRIKKIKKLVFCS